MQNVESQIQVNSGRLNIKFFRCEILHFFFKEPRFIGYALKVEPLAMKFFEGYITWYFFWK